MHRKKRKHLYLVTRMVISSTQHLFGLHILIIIYSEIYVANAHLDSVHSTPLLLALLFIPNVFSHSSTESFLFPGDLLLPDGILMYILCLDFSSLSTTLFSSNRVTSTTQLCLFQRILKELSYCSVMSFLIEEINVKVERFVLFHVFLVIILVGIYSFHPKMLYTTFFSQKRSCCVMALYLPRSELKIRSIWSFESINIDTQAEKCCIY